jgi:hypothetical protein
MFLQGHIFTTARDAPKARGSWILSNSNPRLVCLNFSKHIRTYLLHDNPKEEMQLLLSACSFSPIAVFSV